ncbi:hypothetical protein [Roseibium sediminis]|uniref:hypothetical protein n=1 Tax=Roseibium sediminis TaxID=1775174 RepID=UPI00123CF759|nr:hypothetical protein [Roseibium sediminis]
MRTIRNIDQLLGLLNRGRFAEKCNEALESCLEALQGMPNGKGKAKITIELTIASDHDRLDVTPVVKSKLPETGAFTATPFWNDEGALSVEHPNQRDMFNGPRAAEPRPAEPRERADLNG